jgi:hypothetical protein
MPQRLTSIHSRCPGHLQNVASHFQNQASCMQESSHAISEDILSPQTSSSEDCDSKELEDVLGLISLVRKRIQLKTSYFQLIALCFFFCVFSATISIQQSTISAFRIHSRYVLLNLINVFTPLLPPFTSQ